MQLLEASKVRPESLQTFQPSYAPNKVKNENDVIRNRISGALVARVELRYNVKQNSSNA